jgi:hypothetical protein
MAIAVTALVIAPRAFGRSERSLPAVERIALHESIRLNATLRLLDERNLPGDITNPMRKIREDLKNGDVSSARSRLAAFKTRVDEEIQQAEDRNAALDAMRESDVLEKLAELLSTGAKQQDVAREATARLDKDAPAVNEALREVLERLSEDSDLRQEVEEALEAARKRDAQALVKAMEKLSRKMANQPREEDLKMARNRLKFLGEKLGRPGGKYSPDMGDAGPADSPAGKAAPVPEIAAQTALEEAIEREKVPERFRNLVRMYFARSEENMRREK